MSQKAWFGASLGFPVLCEQPALALHPRPPGSWVLSEQGRQGRAKAPEGLCFMPFTQHPPLALLLPPWSWHRPPSHTLSFPLGTDTGRDSCP